MKMKYEGILLSDVHIDRSDLDKLYNEYKSLVIDYISKMKKLDFLVILGDWFDHKLFLNSRGSEYSYKMLHDLFEVCAEKNTKIRIVYGTESHECDQYNLINNIDTFGLDVKVIKHVSEEDLFDDLKVLYLPEESIYNKSEYYKEYFSENQKYDYVFGHGVIREAMKEAAASIESSSGNRRKVPVFSTAELERICRGKTYFGHYHVHTVLGVNDAVSYVGSFTRWEFGEEEDKGFYHISCNPSKDNYSDEFIVNTLCQSYKTIYFGYDNSIFKEESKMQDALEHFDSLVKKDVFDHLRLEFNIPEDANNPEYMINLINEKYKFNQNIKTEIKHGYIEKEKERKKKEIKEVNEKYSFIFDKNIDIAENTRHYIAIEYEKTYPVKIIETILTAPLQEILNSDIFDEIKEDTE